MPPAVAPERCWCIYRGERLVLIFRALPGPLYPAIAPGRGPVVERSRFRGQLFAVDEQPMLLKVLRQAPDEAELVRRLAALGLEAQPTPISAVASRVQPGALGGSAKGASGSAIDPT